MGQDSIDKVLELRKQAEKAAAENQTRESEGDKFYSILVGETEQEHFLELQFRIGLRLCFSYTDLQWFHFDPEAGCLDLEFGGFLVTIKGRGIADRLFTGIKKKRVSWVKEADHEMQDHPGNETFIQEIRITPPQSDTQEQ